ncbi:efflux RND transporter periplasmic adaptor subunit [Castellaniella sp.]|uniref:efflux RND transporter periplasmic adaptor subunit n=1 Tax=Castellaniella sp. TaxID=1955812 RepID=UPI0025C197E1|nr:efflux RND transporter periplasmic adaptor subunit [Castellaniella sp.]
MVTVDLREPSPMSSVRRSVLLFGLPLFLLLCAVLWWLSRPVASPTSSAPPAADAVLVHTTQVAARNVPARVLGIGAVQAWSTVTVRSRIDGQLESVGFHEGDMVHQGQLLARLDDRVQKAQLAQARAQQARDQAQLDNAHRDLARYTELVRQSAIQRQTLDTQRAQVATLEATVQADQAQVQYAQVQLDYTRIVSPLTGRTGVLQVDPGNLVHSTDVNGLVVINQMEPIAVSFTVPDTLFPEVQAASQATVASPVPASSQVPVAEAGTGRGKDAPAAHTRPLPVEVYVQGKTDLLGSGTLVLIDNQIDSASGTLRLKAKLDNPAYRLWPGQTVDVRLILGDRPGALVVPDAAIQRGAEGLYVYVVQGDDTVSVQPVSVLVSQDGLSVISKGLSAGQRVVVDGQYKLRPGLKIAEAPAETAKAGAAS